MQSSDENSVYLSVKHVMCDKWKKDRSRFLYHKKDLLALAKEEKEWLMGANPST